MPIEALRAERSTCRRRLELTVLRARQGGPAREPDIADLRRRVDALTQELITRYAADLDLVDSLLDPAYPRNVTDHPSDDPRGAR